MSAWPAIAELLADAGVQVSRSRDAEPVAGGDINAAWRVPTNDGSVFVKTNAADALAMFSAERDALLEIAATGSVRVPQPLAVCGNASMSLLALEWLELGSASANIGREFGRQLAELHRHLASQHGWHRDNTIGRTPQPNHRCDHWPDFFREYRLKHQLTLAASRGHTGELQLAGSWLSENLESLFAGYEPQPSLLHGDLWGGNWAACGGRPVMFDPASYYGDRETDLAMTRLFGGFGNEFYAAYEASWPLAPGAAEREKLYQLYHVLNHLNLFGAGYKGQALALMSTLRRCIERRSWRA